MKIFKKILYILRIILFLFHFFFLYSIISTLLQVKPLIYLFLILHFIFVINTIIEMLSKKKSYQQDYVYNLMQIGVYFYIGIIFYRVYFTHIFYMRETIKYFNINFCILCFLIIFLLLYSHYELKERRKL